MASLNIQSEELKQVINYILSTRTYLSIDLLNVDTGGEESKDLNTPIYACISPKTHNNESTFVTAFMKDVETLINTNIYLVNEPGVKSLLRLNSELPRDEYQLINLLSEQAVLNYDKIEIILNLTLTFDEECVSGDIIIDPQFKYHVLLRLEVTIDPSIIPLLM